MSEEPEVYFCAKCGDFEATRLLRKGEKDYRNSWIGIHEECPQFDPTPRYPSFF